MWQNLTQVSDRAEEDRAKVGAAKLQALMQSRGLSVRRLSDLTQQRGRISTSSIRAYLAEEYLPKPGTAINLAVVFGPDAGHELLDAWGFDAAASAWPEIVLDLYTPEEVSANFRPDVILTDGERTTYLEGKSQSRTTTSARLTVFDGVPSISYTTEEDEEGKVWQVITFDGPALTDGDRLIIGAMLRRLQGLLPPATED